VFSFAMRFDCLQQNYSRGRTITFQFGVERVEQTFAPLFTPSHLSGVVEERALLRLF
jgi:hypothetical protein